MHSQNFLLRVRFNRLPDVYRVVSLRWQDWAIGCRPLHFRAMQSIRPKGGDALRLGRQPPGVIVAMCQRKWYPHPGAHGLWMQGEFLGWNIMGSIGSAITELISLSINQSIRQSVSQSVNHCFYFRSKPITPR